LDHAENDKAGELDGYLPPYHDFNGIIYAPEQMDPNIKFKDAACAMLTKVPRVFLKTVLQGCIDYAKENSITLITKEDMKAMNDKRAKEKRR